MPRRLPKEIIWAQDGPHGRPAEEIRHRWISKAKRRTHKRERREGQDEINKSRND